MRWAGACPRASRAAAASAGRRKTPDPSAFPTPSGACPALAGAREPARVWIGFAPGDLFPACPGGGIRHDAMRASRAARRSHRFHRRRVWRLLVVGLGVRPAPGGSRPVRDARRGPGDPRHHVGRRGSRHPGRRPGIRKGLGVHPDHGARRDRGARPHGRAGNARRDPRPAHRRARRVGGPRWRDSADGGPDRGLHRGQALLQRAHRGQPRPGRSADRSTRPGR